MNHPTLAFTIGYAHWNSLGCKVTHRWFAGLYLFNIHFQGLSICHISFTFWRHQSQKHPATHSPCRNFEESKSESTHYVLSWFKPSSCTSLSDQILKKKREISLTTSGTWGFSRKGFVIWSLESFQHQVNPIGQLCPWGSRFQMVPASSGSFHSCFSIGKSSCSDTKPQFLEVYRPQMNETGVVFICFVNHCQYTVYIYNSMTSLNSIPTDLMADEFVGLPPKSPLVLAGPFQETQLVCIPTC